VKIGVVGPCASGKSTLVKRLRGQYGFELRHIAQEHSYVPTMWKKISNPDWLIFLDVSYPVSMQRRPMNWTLDDYQEQQRRLAHARTHANFYLNTDALSQDQVVEEVIGFLKKVGAWNANDESSSH